MNATSASNAKRKSTKKKVSTSMHYVERAGGPEDNISRFLEASKLVPEKFRGTEKFLDIVSWNIRWFDAKDPERVKAIADVLETINADVFVLTEIAEDGALGEIADILAKRKAGFYSLNYGTTGGQQRVVLMWDRDWVRAKHTPAELFENEPQTTAENGRKTEVFPRRPLWGHFEALSEDMQTEGFTFELVGVHLKSQMPPKGFTGGGRYGIKQRTAAARLLAKWLITDSEHYDEDVLIIGDWNASTELEEWKPIRKLESDGEVAFADINPPGEPTHLARLNKSGPAGTRLDLVLLTKAADAVAVPGQKGIVIEWSLFEHLSDLETEERKELFKRLKERFSDHLPLVTRFYFTDGSD